MGIRLEFTYRVNVTNPMTGQVKTYHATTENLNDAVDHAIDFAEKVTPREELPEAVEDWVISVDFLQ